MSEAPTAAQLRTLKNALLRVTLTMPDLGRQSASAIKNDVLASPLAKTFKWVRERLPIDRRLASETVNPDFVEVNVVADVAELIAAYMDLLAGRLALPERTQRYCQLDVEIDDESRRGRKDRYRHWGW
jgi:hypothetical protein